MKVLLLSANQVTTPYPVYPIGLDYVAAALQRRHVVRIADMNQVGDHGHLAALIDTFTPDIVGISIRNIDNTDNSAPKGFLNEYRDLVGIIRKESRALVILGGSGFTLFPEELLNLLGADYGIIGEGERMPLLLEALETGGVPENITGVVTPKKKTITIVPWRGDIFRSDAGTAGHTGYYLDRGGMLNLQTKRGCPYRCIYCTYPHIEGKVLRCHAPEEVAREALAIQKAGARYFFITDSAFNCDPKHAMAVAEAFIRKGISIPWGAFFAPTAPPKNFYIKLAAAGLTHVEFGTESLDDRVLATYGKPFRVHHILKAHDSAIQAGLHVAHYFLLGGPGETRNTLDETMAQVAGLSRSVFFFFCGMRIYPNTRAWRISVAEGKLNKKMQLLQPFFYPCDDLSENEIIYRVMKGANGKRNWLVGAGGDDTFLHVQKLYERGYSGPLWEYLIQ